MAEKKTLKDLVSGGNDNNENKHLDISTIAFPQSEEEKKNDKEELIKKLGLDEKVFEYDENDFNKIKDINEYDGPRKQELKLWLAQGFNPSFFDKANELPSLKRMEIIRFLLGLAELSDNTNEIDNEYKDYQNEYNDDTLEKLVIINTFINHSDSNNKLVISPLNLPKEEDKRKEFYNKIDDYLVIKENQDKISLSNDEITKYPKDVLDEIIVGSMNGVNVINQVNNAISMGILDKFPDDPAIINKMRIKLEDNNSSIAANDRNKSIKQIVNRIIARENSTGIFSNIISANSLNIESKQDKELLEKNEKEREEKRLAAEQKAILKQEEAKKNIEKKNKEEAHNKEIEEENDLNKNNFSFEPISAIPNENTSNKKLVRKNSNPLVNKAINGFSSKEEIKQSFEEAINYLRMLEESVLRSFDD